MSYEYYENTILGLGDQLIMILTQGNTFQIYKFKNPHVKEFSLTQPIYNEITPVFGGGIITKSFPITVDLDLSVSIASIDADGNSNYEVIIGTGDWRKELDLFENFSIKDLFKAINKKIDKRNGKH